MTATEIIQGIRHADDDWDAASAAQVLAERVEAVLALEPLPEPKSGIIPQTAAHNWNRCLAEVRRILNGESE
jgi:hypothetical protein